MRRLFLRSCVFTLVVIQLSCILVLCYHATFSGSAGGGGGIGGGISPILPGGLSLKSLKLLLSDPALQKINISSPEIYSLKDQELGDYFR